jgi:hypothetical protein
MAGCSKNGLAAAGSGLYDRCNDDGQTGGVDDRELVEIQVEVRPAVRELGELFGQPRDGISVLRSCKRGEWPFTAD